jgi:ABC-type thiamin/hydroxymethylpyrimidine transport system permease subunit
MFASIITGATIIGWNFSGNIIEPLFHHPAYPVFSDHTLLALAILLVAGHLGGVRVEKTAASIVESELINHEQP